MCTCAAAADVHVMTRQCLLNCWDEEEDTGLLLAQDTTKRVCGCLGWRHFAPPPPFLGKAFSSSWLMLVLAVGLIINPHQATHENFPPTPLLCRKKRELPFMEGGSLLFGGGGVKCACGVVSTASIDVERKMVQ